MLVELNTVYAVSDVPENERGEPSFEFADGSVNVYISNKTNKPANASEMTLDDGSPFGIGIWGRNKRIKWILFETVSGTPVINEFGIINKNI